MAVRDEVVAKDRGASRAHDIPIGLKATLQSDEGVAYRDFRMDLTPRWGRLWLAILAGYVSIFGVIALLLIWAPGGLLGVAAGLGAAVIVGYSIAYLNNYFHESAHYNLLPSRRANDVVTNLLMSWLFASTISIYRRIHWQHHRALGTTMDSENSYFDPLRIRYLVEGLLGLKVLRTLRRYREMERETVETPSEENRRPWVLLALVVNGGIVAGSWALGSWPAAVAWAGGELGFFPFFVSLRQTLEHRSEDADAHTDYRLIDHGPTNRIFGDGPLADTLGSAGFNRHALHHWEPQVSCTRLRDLEGFLSATELEPYLAERRTTYAKTFTRLLEP